MPEILHPTAPPECRPPGSSLSSYCLILPHSWFISIAIHPSPKPFPSVCRILASLEIKSSKTPRTVHNLLSFPHHSWNILKPALHLAPLLPWRYQVDSIPASVAQSRWFVISTILPAHSSAHSLNFSTVETLQTLSLG